MPPSQYAPDESQAVRFSERTWLQGAFIAAVAYGMEVILYSMSSYWLCKARNTRNSKKNTGLIIYTTIMFVLGTLYIAALLQFTQDSFVDGRNIPGGPSAYETIMFSVPIDMLGNVTMVMLSWMCDIINVWRCVVIYSGSDVPIWIVCAIPFLLYVGSVVLGICFLKQVGATSQSPWSATGINFTIPYYSMSLALNILVTILIVVRLLLFRRRINKLLGKSHGAHYASLAAMIVESAAMYSSFALLFLVPFALHSPISQIFIQSLPPVQNVSTFLIIFRIAQGKGWSQDTITRTLAGQTTEYGRSGPREERQIRFRTINTTSTESQLRPETLDLPNLKADEVSNTASSGFIESGVEKLRTDHLEGS
ncbi:hypothetical protein JB92DRAFT_2735378 [Gautieria morchelliformis]|nr:hypothetical protein JB92DRAFT_2735378 [Gautieria morchelliformis]